MRNSKLIALSLLAVSSVAGAATTEAGKGAFLIRHSAVEIKDGTQERGHKLDVKSVRRFENMITVTDVNDQTTTAILQEKHALQVEQAIIDGDAVVAKNCKERDGAFYCFYMHAIRYSR